MDRAREQTLLVLAVVIALHAGGLIALVGTRFFTAQHEVAARGADTIVPAAPAPPPQALPPEVPPEPVDLNALGEAQGEGNSIASVDLPDVSRSPRPSDLEQAWMRREPTVTPPPQPAPSTPPAAAAPSAAVEPRTEVAAAAELIESRPTLPFGSIPVPVGEATRTQAGVEATEPRQTESEARADAAEARDASPPRQEPAAALSPPPVEPPPSPTAATARPANATPVEASDDPAPQGQNDLDAFAQAEGVDFQRGGVQARRGRETKLVRPRIDLSFMADATRLSGRDLIIKLRIATDASGKPRRVDVAESSGSESIDNAVRLAIYDSWFGGRMPDEFPFTVRFVTR